MSLMVSIQHTLKSRSDESAFSLDVSFHVENGEVLGLLGPSGSGKSITLKSIAGIEKPNSGRIELDSVVLYDSLQAHSLPVRARKVGYLFQSYALFPTMTVLQNVQSGIHRLPKEPYGEWKERALHLGEYYLHMFHIGGLGKRYPRQLSGGQQQRVALARLLASQPKTLLLDEPFSALDAHLTECIEDDLKQALATIGCPVILVTHNPVEVQHYCNRCLVLEAGNIQAEHQIRNSGAV